MESRDKHQLLSPSEIEKIFDARFEDSSDRKLELPEIVKKIKSYGARYDPNSGLSAEDQLLACEAVAEATPIKPKDENEKNDLVFSVSGSDNATYYRRVNSALSPSYLQTIPKLKRCNYKTPPVEISVILEQIFGPSGKEGHWLWIAQRYNPRQIIWVLNRMMKQTLRGEMTINSPAAYFTKLIKFRKKRIMFRKNELTSSTGNSYFPRKD